MRPETETCLMQLHALETMIYRFEQAGMADAVDQLGEHLRTMLAALRTLVGEDVLIAPVVIRTGTGDGACTFQLALRPTSIVAARTMVEELAAWLSSAVQRNLIHE